MVMRGLKVVGQLGDGAFGLIELVDGCLQLLIQWGMGDVGGRV